MSATPEKRRVGDYTPPLTTQSDQPKRQVISADRALHSNGESSWDLSDDPRRRPLHRGGARKVTSRRGQPMSSSKAYTSVGAFQNSTTLPSRIWKTCASLTS